MITKELLEKEIEFFKQEQSRALDNAKALDGAIQFAEQLITFLEKQKEELKEASKEAPLKLA